MHSLCIREAVQVVQNAPCMVWLRSVARRKQHCCCTGEHKVFAVRRKVTVDRDGDRLPDPAVMASIAARRGESTEMVIVGRL
jgi:hypothetical protein